MIISIPSGWPEMAEDVFEQFLAQCPDYRTDSVANARKYRYTWNNEVFAVISGDKIFVHPEIAPEIKP